MKDQRARGQGTRKPGESAPPAEAPELPTGKAFVLQLSRETGPALDPFTGRVEHLATGRRLRFDSLATFQAAVIRLLADGHPQDLADRSPEDEGVPGT